MHHNHLACTAFAMAALSLPLAAGCGSKAPPAAPTAQKEAASGSSTSGASTTATSTAPAEVSLVKDGAETAPAQSVAIFLDSLRKGDERAANGVLTTLARQELAKSTYQIQPLGTPAGQYQIGRVGFPYPEKNVALVECTWTEPAVEGGEPEVMDIVCEVQLEEEGWRISGIGVTIPGTDQALVLDFEDAASLQATIDAATGQAAPAEATQLATGAGGSQAALPPLPAADGSSVQPATATGSNSATLPSYPQIALPPLDNAPLNR